MWGDNIENILKLAEENQRKAWKVIEDTRVREIWKEHGAQINLVDSMVTNLLMKHRDIDFHIYVDKLNVAESFAAISELAQNPRIKKVSYNNLLDCEDCCL